MARKREEGENEVGMELDVQSIYCWNRVWSCAGSRKDTNEPHEWCTGRRERRVTFSFKYHHQAWVYKLHFGVERYISGLGGEIWV